VSATEDGDVMFANQPRRGRIMPFQRSVVAGAVALALLGAGLFSAPGVRPLTSVAPAPVAEAAGPATAAEAIGDLAAVDPAVKISRGLRELARAKGEPKRLEPIVVRSVQPLDLGGFADYVHQFALPGGEHVAVLTVATGDLLTIARLPGVFAIDWASAEAPSERPDHPDFTPALPEMSKDPRVIASVRDELTTAPSWWETRAAIEAAEEGEMDVPGAPSGAATSDRPDPGERGAADGWYDIRGGHAAREAWEMGFTGAGVRVAVLDDAVDFAHPDLQGTWATLPEGHPYVGWPQVFDPMVGYLRAQDLNPTRAPETWSTRTGGNGMVELYQDAPVTMREMDGATKATACFRPRQVIGPATGPFTPTLAAPVCDYVVPRTSKSGTIRYGHHPDGVLATLGAKPEQQIQSELAGVILVDEHARGLYDTVYVDIDADHDFTDEKPMSRADPIGWRDVNGDRVADLSGGLLYFISDGKLPFPASWVWGVDKETPEAGRVIGILYVLGSHGTLCASNIVSQGRLGVPAGRDLHFRDLPGNQEPRSVNLGLAPHASMVSVGEIYAFGRSMFAPSWHYAVFGHDVERRDDQIQITSNSYGFSDGDSDGWEPDSRLIDFYVRRYSPETSFHTATGNGGPGYGTIVPPMPSVGMDIAASTQFGSTGADSITDTTQITFGDVIPFSNRGPGANGNHGPDIAADGAFAAGAVPINFISVFGGGDGTLALGTWGGTSRATPVAAGATALAYQAFRGRHGRWPTWEEAKAVMQAGARFAGYDTFTIGAGVVDAADSARIASGRHGVYAVPSEWQAGHYRGAKPAAFAKMLAPGESDTRAITLHNPSSQPLTVQVSGATLRRIGHDDDSFVTDRTAESQSAAPDYLRPIDRSKVPPGTELMVVRTAFPFEEFDVGGDQVADNFFSMGVIQHTDINGDGKLWVDRNGNGVVNSRQLRPAYVHVSWDEGEADYDAIEGAFTTPVPAEGFTAEIAWYGLGCSDTEGNPPPPAQEVQEKIALIERGTCTFYQKLSNAIKAGAIGAVVFTDARPLVTMGSAEGNVEIPAMMIERESGLTLRALLESGAVATASMRRRTGITLKGIDGAMPIVYPDSEIQQYEYMRMTDDFGLKNHFALSVHHPLQRWSSGLYLALWHALRAEAVTNTHVTARMDFYGYKPWTALALSESSVTIPPGGQATVNATLRVPPDAPYGAMQGAIFVDYARGPGDEPVAPPGGYELEQKRVVIPVNTTVGATYKWQGAVTLGGSKADDRDAPYNNGAMWGTFKWNWRPESGDWRFHFVDAAEKPAPGTFWLFRTTWQDPGDKQADIDTRVYGPVMDPYSNPADPANHAVPVGAAAAVDRSDPAWYGPYTLGLLARSTYLALGSLYPFSTSSGGNDDWLVAPAGEGLHEVMLDNIRFSGKQIEMPFETTASSIRIGTRLGTDSASQAGGYDSVTLVGATCSKLEITSQMDLPGFRIRGFGMSVPQVTADNEAKQDTMTDVSTASFKKDFSLAGEAGRFSVKIAGRPGDDLDLFVLYDANADGKFEYPTESLGAGTSPLEVEEVTLPGFAAAGNYQIWVHGFTVQGGAGTFKLTIDVVTGDTIQLSGVPAQLQAGQTASVEVCANQQQLQGEAGPAHGLVVFGPSGAPAMFRLPVTWWRKLPSITLPLVVRSDFVGGAD